MGLALWPQDNPIQQEWITVRADWSKPGSPYGFWMRLYDSLLDPAAHPRIPDELLYQIALIDSDMWEGEDAPEKIAQEIARLERAYYGTNSANADPNFAVVKNAKTIALQLESVLVYLESKLLDLRKINDVPVSQQEHHDKSISLLADLIERVEKMLAEFEGGIASDKALVVVEEQVPAVFKDAETLDDLGGNGDVAAYVSNFAVVTKHLTDNGTPGHVASGIAGFETLIRKPFQNWREAKKSKKR